MKTLKTIGLLLLILSTFWWVSASVENDVNNIRAWSDVWTFGTIITTIFDSVWKIQAVYIDATETLNDLHTEIPTSKAIKDYVDANSWASSINDLSDGSYDGYVNTLDGERGITFRQSLISLICLITPYKPNKPNKPN